MRAAGVVSLVLLTAVTVLGIATAQRWQIGRLPRGYSIVDGRPVPLELAARARRAATLCPRLALRLETR